MANQTTNLDTISAAQAAKEVTANEMFDAMSQASAFGRQALQCSALTWGFYGANMVVDGVLTQIANGTLSLTASTTNYIEATRAGVVSVNQTSFTPGQIPLYEVITDTSAVTDYTDYRVLLAPPYIQGQLVKAMADANQTLTAEEARCDILECTGALTAQRDLIVPLGARQWTVFANVTGAGIRVIGTSGTGIVVAVSKRAIVYADGTNIVRVTADL